MATSSFSELRDGLDSALQKLKPLITRLQTSAGNKDAAREANSEATRLLRDAERALKSMENEARGSAPSQRRALQDAISECKSELSSVRLAIQRANDTASRSELLAKSESSTAAELDARERMAAATEAASRGTAKLQQAQSLLVESHDVGVNVIDTLEQQRTALLRSTDKTKDVNTLTKTARSILRGMQARAITNKAVLCKCHDIIHLPCMKRRECHMCTLVYLAVVVILVILGCIGLVVYFGYIASPKPK